MESLTARPAANKPLAAWMHAFWGTAPPTLWRRLVFRWLTEVPVLSR